jgi:hypothetical protein
MCSSRVLGFAASENEAESSLPVWVIASRLAQLLALSLAALALSIEKSVTLRAIQCMEHLAYSKRSFEVIIMGINP